MDNRNKIGYRTHYDIERDGESFGGTMEICTHCDRFERRFDFDTFTMADYQSCENCRHLGPEDRCTVK